MKFNRLSASLLVCTALVAAPTFGRDEPTSRPTGATTRPSVVEKSVEKIDVTTFDALRSASDTLVLDVRTPDEFASGHVPGAVNVPYSKAGFDASIATLDKSKTYLVYCHSGKRSFLSSKQMQSAGFDHLYNFNGGIVAWEKAGKAMQTNATEPTTKRS